MKQVANYSSSIRLTFILSFVIFALLSQKSNAQEIITIQQAVENTLKNNLTIKQAQFSAALSDETLKQSKNALYPNLNGSASYNTNFGRSTDPTTNQFISQKFSSIGAGLTAGADLFQGFAKINQIRQNKLLLDAEKTNVDKIRNDLVLSVVTAYMQILYNRDLLAASQQQLEVAKQTNNREQALLDAGNKTLADVSQAKSQVATAELNVTNAQNNLAVSYLTLNQLMEMPSEYRFQVQAPLIADSQVAKGSYDVMEIYESALKSFPDIRLAALRTAAAAKSIDIARASYSPSLSIGAGTRTNYSSGQEIPTLPVLSGSREIGRTISGESVVIPTFSYTNVPYTFGNQFKDNFSQYIGLSLSVPIFNGFNARTNVRKAKLNFQNTQVQEQLSKNNLSKIISQAVLDLKAAESRYASTTNAFNAQKDAFYVVEQRYNVGLVNSLDYSTAQTNRNKAEIDMIQAKYDLLFRAKVIDYYLGKQITF